MHILTTLEYSMYLQEYPIVYMTIDIQMQPIAQKLKAYLDSGCVSMTWLAVL